MDRLGLYKTLTLATAALLVGGCELVVDFDRSEIPDGDVPDAAADAARDAGADAGADAGPDGGADAGPDAGGDAGLDAGADAAVDAGMDAGSDAGADADTDAGTDAGMDAGLCDGVDCSGLDGDCTMGVCDPSDGSCSAMPINEGSACDDGDACTNGTTCTSGSCGGGTTVDCSSLDGECTVGVCDPSDGSCSAMAANEGDACDDGDACTSGTTCTSGSCGGGTAVDCGDSMPCTIDACDSASGCVNVDVTDALDELGFGSGGGGEDQVRLTNASGSVDADFSAYYLCGAQGTTECEMIGTATASAGGDVVVTLSSVALALSDGELALSSTDDGTGVCDYVQWGSGGQSLEDEAVAVSEWTAGDFVDTAGFTMDGMCVADASSSNDASSDWQECDFVP